MQIEYRMEQPRYRSAFPLLTLLQQQQPPTQRRWITEHSNVFTHPGEIERGWPSGQLAAAQAHVSFKKVQTMLPFSMTKDHVTRAHMFSSGFHARGTTEIIGMGAENSKSKLSEK